MKTLKNANKKSELDTLAKIILWIVFLLGAVIATYFVVNYLKSLI